MSGNKPSPVTLHYNHVIVLYQSKTLIQMPNIDSKFQHANAIDKGGGAEDPTIIENLKSFTNN